MRQFEEIKLCEDGTTEREGNSTATACVCVMRGGGGDVNYMLMLIRACWNQSGDGMSVTLQTSFRWNMRKK